MKTHRVFISYSSKNIDIANNIYNMLDSRNISCWMAPRYLITGEDYSSSIEKAITSADIIIFIFSKHGLKSRWVKSELSIAFSEQKLIISFKIDNSVPEGIVRMILTKSQWIDALNESNEHYRNLLERVTEALECNTKNESFSCRLLNMMRHIKITPVIILSLLLMFFAKYVNETFLLFNINVLGGGGFQYPEMSIIMTVVSIIVSFSVCYVLRNEGRKWNKVVLMTVFLFAIFMFTFWEMFRSFRYGGNINLSLDIGQPMLILLLFFVLLTPAICAYFFIVRRIPDSIIYFFFYLTIVFGIRIPSPYTIVAILPVFLLYCITSYSWYKFFSNVTIAVFLITLSIYFGMNFVDYTTLVYGS